LRKTVTATFVAARGISVKGNKRISPLAFTVPVALVSSYCAMGQLGIDDSCTSEDGFEEGIEDGSKSRLEVGIDDGSEDFEDGSSLGLELSNDKGSEDGSSTGLKVGIVEGLEEGVKSEDGSKQYM
jgi:hypothetical protein